jgi:poly(glycerol-phosphate) alpha-glucosyltransferase
MDGNMKVACLSGISRSSGGLFHAVGSLCRNLHGQGVDVSVYGRNDQFATEDVPAWSPVPVVPYRGIGPLGSSPGLRRILAGSGAALVHQHGLWLDDQWAALQWQGKTGNPVVVSPHGMLDPWAVQNAAWKKKLVGKLFANQSLHEATCIHALCRSEVESIRAYGLDNPVALIPNGVELPEITSVPKSPGKKRLLFLGRIHPKKGLSELISGWAQAGLKDWELLVAGWDDGGHEAGLRELGKGLGVDSVSFLGPQHGAEKERLLRSVDAFILPSFSEGLPMTVLEAWSYGLPVLMTDFCNLSEGFVAGAALRIEPSSVSIGEGLGHLVAMSESDRGEMGSKGRRLVEQKFTWPSIAKSMKQVYEWCLTGSNPPECMEF